MKLKRFALEVVLDVSFDEKVGGRNRFRYRTKSEFIRFRSSPQNAERNAAMHLQRRRQEEHWWNLVDVHLYREMDAVIPCGGESRRRFLSNTAIGDQ